jgi:hypothetical protein
LREEVKGLVQRPKTLWQEDSLELFLLAELTVPLFHIALLLVLSTLALLLGRVKLALLVNDLFAFYWGYLFNRELLVGSDLEKLDHFTALYFGCGAVIIVLAPAGFLTHRD